MNAPEIREMVWTARIEGAAIGFATGAAVALLAAIGVLL